MSDVEGHEEIVLRPGDTAVPYNFNAAPCSSATANDGAIPYGTNVESVVVTGYKDGADEADDDLVEASSESSNIVQVQLNYPAGGAGKYQLRFALTLDTSQVLNFRFDELRAKGDNN